MSGTVDPRWFRRASWPALQQLAKRRHDELVAAADAHYALYRTGDSWRLLFDPTHFGAEDVETLRGASGLHTDIAKPALSADRMLAAERRQARRVEQLTNAPLNLADGPTRERSRDRRARRRARAAA